MKKKLLLLFLIVVTIFSLNFTVFGADISYVDTNGKTVKLNDFLDTKDHWAHDTILKCADYGLVVGHNGNFMPNNYITRGDLAIVIDRMLGLKYISYNLFTDLSNEAYYKESLLKCVASGYIQGTSGTTVDPKGYATREQVAVIICRIFNIDTPSYSYTSFADDAQISSWAKPSVAAVKRLGYMVGVGGNRFNPKANITRAELITLINNIAGTYIPKKDSGNSGNSFRTTFSTNLMVCRNITLTNSTVGRDIIITPYASGIDLVNTVVFGRIFVMNKSSIDLENSKVSEIYLSDGKSSVDGITENINEIYVSQYASESTLDAIPEKLILEPYTRVRVDGVMYENNTNRIKIYYGDDLKADIAAEQGYVVGGPRIRDGKMTQAYDNLISVEDLQIIAGDSKISEIGVVWLSQNPNAEIVSPTCQNYDGKKVFDIEKISGSIDFNIGYVYNTRNYRVYVKDSDGLYAYGKVYTFTGYDFNIDINLIDNNYPEVFDVEMNILGDNIPNISSVRLVYDINELYSDEHEEVSMRLYSDKDSEYQPDDTKYRRYITTVKSKTSKVDGVTVYTPPTAFGYIITFKDGTFINRFPLITEAVPQGAKPVTQLSIGKISYSGDKTIILDNNTLVTNHVAVQEVGILYRESTAETVTSPEDNLTAWTKVAKGYNIPSKDSFIFDASITTRNKNANTFIALYVRTTGGYYYSNVVKVMNNWTGDEGGPRITKEIETIILDSNNVVIKIPYTTQNDLDVYSNDFVISAIKDGEVDTSIEGSSLRDLDCCINAQDKAIYICLSGLNKNSDYSISLRLQDIEGLYSNPMVVSFNTSKLVDISISNSGEAYGWQDYKIAVPNTDIYVVDSSYLLKEDGTIAQGTHYREIVGNNIVLHTKDLDTTIDTYIELNFEYKVSDNISYEFTRVLQLP